MSTAEPIRIAIIGAARRSTYMYAPIISALPGVELVGAWSRSPDSARRLGETLKIPAYTDLDRLVRETGAQVGIVSVSYSANGEVGLAAVQAGLHVLLETPIAHHLSEADAIIQAAAQRGLKIEVAEQFHRRPLEQIKLKLLESGLFGKVYTSFSDFAGHGYHGISVMRSYLGFDARPVQVVGSIQQYELGSHWSRLGNNTGPRTETQEHGIYTFEGGQTGIFHWTNVGYDSPLRWWRSSRFLAERGMGITIGSALEAEERITLLAPGSEAPRTVKIERRLERVDGGGLLAMIAHTGDPDLPIITWENPFQPAIPGFGPQWQDDYIGVAGCLLSLIKAIQTGGEPTYGPYQARLDQELVLALRQSSEAGGAVVKLPL